MYRDPFMTILTVLSVVVLAFATFPLLVTAVTAFNAGTQTVFPPEGWSLRWFRNILDQPDLVRSAGVSFALAVCASCLSITLGLMSGIALTKSWFPGRDVVDSVLLSPLLVPQIILGLSFLIFFVRIESNYSFLNLLLLHTVLTFPYALRVIRSSLQKINPKLEEAAIGMGASPWQALFMVVLPQIKPSLFVAVFFCFVVSFDNFTATAFVTTTGETLPVQMFFYIESSLDPTISAISALLIVASAILVIAADRIVGVQRLV